MDLEGGSIAGRCYSRSRGGARSATVGQNSARPQGEGAMTRPSRRVVMQGLGIAVLSAGAWGLAARAAMGPNDKFDLLVKGGEVLDPSQNLRAPRDIGIRYGVVEALEPSIPA